MNPDGRRLSMTKRCDFCEQPYPEHLPACPHARARSAAAEKTPPPSAPPPAPSSRQSSAIRHAPRKTSPVTGKRWNRTTRPAERRFCRSGPDEEDAQPEASPPDNRHELDDEAETTAFADDVLSDTGEEADSVEEADDEDVPKPPSTKRAWLVGTAGGALLGAAACFGTLWATNVLALTPPAPPAPHSSSPPPSPLMAAVRNELARQASSRSHDPSRNRSWPSQRIERPPVLPHRNDKPLLSAKRPRRRSVQKQRRHYSRRGRIRRGSVTVRAGPRGRLWAC